MQLSLNRRAPLIIVCTKDIQMSATPDIIARGERSPLLHGQVTKSPLDLVTERIFFIIPITARQVQFLNRIIYRDNLFWINYWSLTHTFFGLLWGLLHLFWPRLFSIRNYIIVHTIFEIWELWAGGYFTGKHPLIIQEIVDLIMDTLFGLLGVYLVIGSHSMQ